MKKVLFSIALLLLPLLVALPVFAQEKMNATLSSDQTHEGDYFGGGDRVTISGIVNGDAYAGGATIVVDGHINGDLLAGGGNITISGDIQGDVRTGGGNITFSNANIGGNVTVGGGNIVIDSSTQIRGSIVAGGGNLQILAPIGRGATIGGGSVLIGNSIGGDINAGVGELSLTPDASVNGDLNYWSENKANIANGASISGAVRQEVPERKDEAGAKGAAVLAGFLFTLKLLDAAWLLVVGLAIIIFLPNYADRTSQFVRERFGWALLTGLIASIILPVIGVILLLTVFGIPAAVVLFFAYLLLMWLGRIFTIYALGQFALARTGNKAARGWVYVAGLVIYFILTLIPIVNLITEILATLSGAGALLAMKREYYSDLRKKKLL